MTSMEIGSLQPAAATALVALMRRTYRIRSVLEKFLKNAARVSGPSFPPMVLAWGSIAYTGTFAPTLEPAQSARVPAPLWLPISTMQPDSAAAAARNRASAPSNVTHPFTEYIFGAIVRKVG